MYIYMYTLLVPEALQSALDLLLICSSRHKRPIFLDRVFVVWTNRVEYQLQR